MKIIEQHFQFESLTMPYNGKSLGSSDFPENEALRVIEIAGRKCYKSEDKITLDSTEAFVQKATDIGHHSVIEHMSVGVTAFTDRGVSHEIVRHRLASYSQESTRYCNYSLGKFGGELTVILPVWFRGLEVEKLIAKHDEYYENEVSIPKREVQFLRWWRNCAKLEKEYLMLLEEGQTPQEARSILPNSLKTEIFITFNVREWRHFFNLRASSKSHPQMVDLARQMLIEFNLRWPVLFKDLHKKYIVEG